MTGSSGDFCCSPRQPRVQLTYAAASSAAAHHRGSWTRPLVSMLNIGIAAIPACEQGGRSILVKVLLKVREDHVCDGAVAMQRL